MHRHLFYSAVVLVALGTFGQSVELLCPNDRYTENNPCLIETGLIAEHFEIEPDKPPKLNVEKNIDVPHNTNVSLECTGNKPLDWRLTHACCKISERLRVIESYDPNKADDKYYSKLEIVNAIFSDTGKYTCFYNTTSLESSSSSVYIYVNDPENLFAWPDLQVIPAISSQPLNIPCRPTDSKLNLTLWFSNEEQIPVDNKTVFFDHTQGFWVQHPNHSFNDQLICKAAVGSTTKEVRFYVHMTVDRGHIPALEIDTSLAKHPMVNGSFTLICSVEVEPDFGAIELSWEATKHEYMLVTEGRIIISDPKVTKVNRVNFVLKKVTRLLTFKNLTHDDSDNYTCFAQDIHGNFNYNTVTVEVHDTGMTPFINLSSHITEPFESDLNGKLVMAIKWQSSMALEKVDVYWRKDKKVLQNGERIKITHNKTYGQTVLTIPNLQRNDSGYYTLVAESGKVSSIKSIFLHINAIPLVTLSEQLPYYKANSDYQLKCNVEGYPDIKYWWQYKKCSSFHPLNCEDRWEDIDGTHQYGNQPSFEPSRSIEHITPDSVRISINVTARESGLYRCNGQNKHGLKRQTTQFVVSDGTMGFEMEPWKEAPIEKDSVNITVNANLLKYNASSLELYRISNENEEPILLTNFSNTKLYYYETNYSQVLQLKIKDIQMDQSGEYFFQANSLGPYSTVENITFNITVLSIIKPTLVSNITSESVEFPSMHKDGSLNCTVAEGRPTPTIQWYKDGRGLNNNSYFTLLNDGQRLVIAVATKKTVDGNYYCLVQNKGGIQKRSFTVKVTGEDDDDKPGPSTIVMAVVLPICLLALLVVVSICLKGLHKERKERRELELLTQMLFDKGQTEMLNPNLPLDDQVELLPYDHKWEFPKDRLKLGRILGQGAFGRVVRAEAIGMEEGENSSTVAVKMLKERADLAQRKALVAELKILIHLGKHLNIVNLLGAVTKQMKKGELMVIVEYCRYGNLRNYLLRHKARFVNQLDPETGMLNPALITLPNSPINSGGPPNFNTVLSNPIYGHQSNYANLQHDSGCDTSGSGDGVYTVPTSPIQTSGGPSFRWLSIKESDYQGQPVTTCDLLCFAFQCARGMEYLASRKLIHRDLAARNVLLAADNVVKICDFGLAKDCYKYDNYVKKGDGLLPIKWMAIESLADKVFTTKSDVWSFGVLLWEFFTLGGDPYPGTELDEEFYKKLKGGYRMEKPEMCPNNIYDLMMQCWDANPDKRPHFHTLGEILGDHLAKGVKQYYLELNCPYAEMNINKQEDYLAMCGAESTNYLNMITESPTSVVHYDNIHSVRPVVDELLSNEPMEAVPMIQLLEPVRVRFRNSIEKMTPPDSPESGREDQPFKTDYLMMGEIVKNDSSEFSRNKKGNESQRSDTSSGFHSDLETSGESQVPPSYNIVMDEQFNEVHL